jgi:hyperosmotically inducible protein
MTGSFFGKVSCPRWAARDLALFAILGIFSLAPPRTATPKQDPDNTQANRPGATPDAARADQQGQSDRDRELARKIRRAIVTDKSLSTYAHNVKIIARDGKVTLKGPVRSEEEKNTITAKATQIAGASNVKDDMTIKPKT